MTEETKSKRGGARTGSGRKPRTDEVVNISTRVSQETYEIIRKKSKEAGMTSGRWVDQQLAENAQYFVDEGFIEQSDIE